MIIYLPKNFQSKDLELSVRDIVAKYGLDTEKNIKKHHYNFLRTVCPEHSFWDPLTIRRTKKVRTHVR